VANPRINGTGKKSVVIKIGVAAKTGVAARTGAKDSRKI
jgi:hypothetical protein